MVEDDGNRKRERNKTIDTLGNHLEINESGQWTRPRQVQTSGDFEVK